MTSLHSPSLFAHGFPVGGGRAAGRKTVKAETTIKENYEFRRMYAKGKSGVSSCLVVYCRPNRLGHNRLGVTVGKKLGHAVVRNRVRRRLREIFRLAQPEMKQGYDVIVVGRARAADVSYWELRRAFLRTCAKLSLLVDE